MLVQHLSHHILPFPHTPPTLIDILSEYITNKKQPPHHDPQWLTSTNVSCVLTPAPTIMQYQPIMTNISPPLLQWQDTQVFSHHSPPDFQWHGAPVKGPSKMVTINSPKPLFTPSPAAKPMRLAYSDAAAEGMIRLKQNPERVTAKPSSFTYCELSSASEDNDDDDDETFVPRKRQRAGYLKAYRKKNKDKLCAMVTCTICGSRYQHRSHYLHIKTKKHLKASRLV